MSVKFSVFCLLFLLASEMVKAEIYLPSIISDNMLLQQKSSAKLWGKSTPGESVKVITSWNNKIYESITDQDSAWMVIVKTPSAGGPFTIRFESSSSSIVVKNVMIGEVWICSGQSNMEWNYNWGLDDIKPELQKLFKPEIRFFNVPRKSSEVPLDNCNAQWVICDSNSLKSFSAVGYFYAKRLNKGLNVPFAMINASWGGTGIELWIPADSNKIASTNKSIQQNITDPTYPSSLFNAMIEPLTKFRIAGVIWYQGESNVHNANQYNGLFTKMINLWRYRWSYSFPFYFVQIAPYKYNENFSAAILREGQAQALSIPNTGMVVISDLVDDVSNIHPKNKHDVGYRLAALALEDNYNKNVKGKFPVYRSHTISGSNVLISFDNVYTSLSIKGDSLTEITIAGDDRIFYAAKAKVVNRQLKVWSDKVKRPMSVRYSFSNSGIGNLFSTDGLPVAPFRTDNWILK